MTIALTLLLAAVALPLHVPTWAYVGGQYASSPSAELVQRYLNYAEGGGTKNRVIETDCPVTQSACTPVFYFDANIIFVPRDPTCSSGPQPRFANDPAFTEDWYTHEPDGGAVVHRVQTNKRFSCGKPVDVYYPNVAKPAVARWWKRYLTTSYPQRNTIFFNDDAPFDVASHFYKVGLTTSDEFANDGAFVAANAALSNTLAPRRVFWNAIGPGGGNFTQRNISQRLAQLLSIVPPNVLGYVAENPLYNSTHHTVSAYNVRGVLDAAATIERTTNASVVVLDQGDGNLTSAVDDQIRRVHTALLWLIADGSRAINWEDMANGSSKSIGFYPEELIVPSAPDVSMGAFTFGGSSNGSGCGTGADSDGGGAKALVVACGTSGPHNPTGVYVREFASCSTAARRTGPCAAVLNSSDRDMTVATGWLHRAYRHSVAWSGGALGALGCSACDGALRKGATFEAGRTVVPARDALLLTAD